MYDCCDQVLLQVERVDVPGALSHPDHDDEVAEVDEDILDYGVHLSLLLPPVSERLQVLRVQLGYERLRPVRLPGWRNEYFLSTLIEIFSKPFSWLSTS